MAKRSSGKKQSVAVLETGSIEVWEEATGTDQPHVQQHLIDQVYRTLWIPEGLAEDEKAARIVCATSLLQGIKPADETEGMLAVQMVATHNAAMECLRRATIKGQILAGRDQELKHAEKLLSIYSRQIEVLDKHRGKGQQKVTVEYVHVAKGGQAMVGNIETGKTAEARKTEAEPGTKALPNDPGEVIDMDLAVKKPARRRKS